jgi:1-acyl-sn-glycerol-3-phosphate acyltransferase
MRLQTTTLPRSYQGATVAYAGPHSWQISACAKLLRRLMRRTHTRNVRAYCNPLVVTGLEHLAALDGPAIFIANHHSRMDTLVLSQALPPHIRNELYFGAAADRWFVADRNKLESNPWYQSIVLGHFPLARDGGAKALDYARWLLRQRGNVCLFPEGPRATSDELGAFKQGPAWLALDADAPVVPVYLSGSQGVRGKGAPQAQRGPACVDVLEPIRFVAGTPIIEATAVLRAVLVTRHALERAYQRAARATLHDAA